jgi:AAA family ATP:ADP antiporter
VPFLLRLLGLQHSTPAERRAAAWIAAMFFAALASTFLLRPLRDQFGVDQGVEAMPRLYTWTLVATVVAVLPFWWLANRMPSRRFIPIVVGTFVALLLLLATALAAIGEYDWKSERALGEWFWGGFSAFNVIAPSLVWIHTVEHFRSEQARRLFGLVAVGATVGAITGSWLAGVLSKRLQLPPSAAAVASALLLVAMLFAYRRSLPACRELGGGSGQVASGGVLEGARIVLRSRRAQGIAVYMMLLGIVATAFAAARIDIFGGKVPSAREQHGLLADVELWRQTFVLALQLFCTGRLLQRWPGAALLVSLPAVSILGLGALWLAPALLTINVVDVGRGGAQYAFERPAREVLYTPLSLATKHKVKFLLDTFAFRLGDLAGAWIAVLLAQRGLGTGGAAAVTIVFALAWIALGVVLGRRPPDAASGVAQRASPSTS